MAMILNALDRDNQVTVGGNTFTFKPRQIKHFYQTSIANLIAREKSEFGFVALPEEFEDLEYRNSPEAKQIIESKTKEGVENYCRRLRQLIYNEQVSLKRDIEVSGSKEDHRIHLTDGMVQNMEELAKYQSQKSDAEQRRLDKIKQLEKSIGDLKR